MYLSGLWFRIISFDWNLFQSTENLNPACNSCNHHYRNHLMMMSGYVYHFGKT